MVTYLILSPIFNFAQQKNAPPEGDPAWLWPGHRKGDRFLNQPPFVSSEPSECIEVLRGSLPRNPIISPVLPEISFHQLLSASQSPFLITKSPWMFAATRLWRQLRPRRSARISCEASQPGAGNDWRSWGNMAYNVGYYVLYIYTL